MTISIIDQSQRKAARIVFIISPNFAKVVDLWWFDTPMVIFEIATGLWLLVKGLRPSGIAECGLVAAPGLICFLVSP